MRAEDKRFCRLPFLMIVVTDFFNFMQHSWFREMLLAL